MTVFPDSRLPFPWLCATISASKCVLATDWAVTAGGEATGSELVGGVGRKGIVEGEEAKFCVDERLEPGCRGEATALLPCKEETDDFLLKLGVVDRGSGPSELELRRSRRAGEAAVLPLKPFLGDIGEDSGRAVLVAEESESRLKDSDIAASLFGTGGKGGECDGVCRRLEGDCSPFMMQ